MIAFQRQCIQILNNGCFKPWILVACELWVYRSVDWTRSLRIHSNDCFGIRAVLPSGVFSIFLQKLRLCSIACFLSNLIIGLLQNWGLFSLSCIHGTQTSSKFLCITFSTLVRRCLKRPKVFFILDTGKTKGVLMLVAVEGLIIEG